MVTPAKRKVRPWLSSQAKRNLKQDILDRVVTEDMNARQVYNMRPEYKEYDYTRFSANLRALRINIADNQERAVEDYADLIQDLDLHPRRALTNRGYPFWDTSEAKILLIQDLDDGLHLDLTPSELWETRYAYQLYPLTTFRNHIYQQIRSEKDKAYWMHQREKARRR
jgi:hypothetical protein